VKAPSTSAIAAIAAAASAIAALNADASSRGSEYQVSFPPLKEVSIAIAAIAEGNY
jgi:hypothetical protein